MRLQRLCFALQTSSTAARPCCGDTTRVGRDNLDLLMKIWGGYITVVLRLCIYTLSGTIAE